MSAPGAPLPRGHAPVPRRTPDVPRFEDKWNDLSAHGSMGACRFGEPCCSPCSAGGCCSASSPRWPSDAPSVSLTSGAPGSRSTGRAASPGAARHVADRYVPGATDGFEDVTWRCPHLASRWPVRTGRGQRGSSAAPCSSRADGGFELHRASVHRGPSVGIRGPVCGIRGRQDRPACIPVPLRTWPVAHRPAHENFGPR